ncbi:hypothetical protein CR152_08830 [Massilia violaceinigra]|uniref:PIN domain-containing protein n=1 Tax=Massilia violaceinigra TaxID=2045208 RepID=A0A2D2DI06_9BURK|nr:hypothetical protein [Massilia violaceinigra]ATQ74612.1 hypothetical protein CR152_08830 [Massilia violaceinigra]
MVVDHPLSPGGTTHALLDANVLLPPRLSDILFDMCLLGLFSARWSLNIEAEFLRNWSKVALKRGGDTASRTARQAFAEEKKAEKRLACYKGAVAEHAVFGHDHPAMLAKVPSAVDPRDKHVAAAGLVLLDYARQFNEKDKVFIVSSNLRHLAVSDMAQLGVGVVSPGQFIDHLAQADGARVGRALDNCVNSLENPPYTRVLLLDTLLLHGARKTVQHFSREWGVTPASIGARRK